MKFTGERFIPEADLGTEIQIEHFQRYQAIASLTKGKTVLDAASGAGYGTRIIAQEATTVFGLEIDQETITYARKTHKAKNLTFCQGSIAQLPFPDQSIDVVISFETIEHVDEDVQKLFIEEIKRVLTPNGVLVMSTPDKLIYSDQPNYQNEYHIKEFYRDDFEKFLKPYFKNISFFNQIALLSHLIYNDTTTPLRQLQTQDHEAQNGKYIIALCSESKIHDLTSISAITTDSQNQYQQKVDRVIALQQEIEGKNQDIKNVWDEVHKRDKTITVLTEIRDRHKKTLQNNQQQIATLQEQLRELNEVKATTETFKQDLHSCQKELERIHSTKGWKIAQAFYRVKSKIS